MQEVDKKVDIETTEPRSETDIVVDLLRTRRSERRFTGERIPDAHLEKI